MNRVEFRAAVDAAAVSPDVMGEEETVAVLARIIGSARHVAMEHGRDWRRVEAEGLRVWAANPIGGHYGTQLGWVWLRFHGAYLISLRYLLVPVFVLSEARRLADDLEASTAAPVAS